MRFLLFLLCAMTSAAFGVEPELVDVFTRGKDGYPAYRIPSLAVTRGGALLAFAEGRANLSDHAENDIVLKRSTDGGKTWGPLQVVAEDGTNSLGNPTAVVLRGSGRVLLMYQRYARGFDEHKAEPGLEGPHICRTWIQQSDDEGLTWTPPRDITASVKRPTIVTSTATGPGIGIQLARGPHAGRVIMPFNQGPYGKWKVYSVFSDDQGATWRYGDTAPEAGAGLANEVQFVELADGSVMLNARNQGGPKQRKISISHDGGESWSPLRDDPVLIESECQASLLRHPGGGDPSRDVFLFSNPATLTGRTNGVVRLSRDEGKTWPLSRVLYSGGFAYSCLASLSDGSIGCLFERDGYKTLCFARFSLNWLEPTSAGLSASWPSWRGPNADGVAPLANPPVRWSEKLNVGWKVELPGKGHSSPIVLGDRVYLLAAAPVGPAQKPVFDSAPGVHDSIPVTHRHEYFVMALRRSDGQVVWKKTVREEWPHEGGHQTGSPASASPTTDGEFLYASFGSRGLYCLDLDGNIKWQNDLGKMQTLHAHGEGSSPVVYQDTLLLNWDHEGDSFLYAFNKRTGEQLWKTARDEKTSWSTPLVVVSEGKPQVVVAATKRLRGYDLATGVQLWESAGLTDNVVASPVHHNGTVVAGNSYYVQSMVAVRLAGAHGDITGTTNVAWTLRRLTPYVSSPLLYDDTLYFLRHNQNILSRLDPDSGKPLGEPLRLEGINDFIFASPVGAAGRIYVTARDGTTVVLRHDRENAMVAVNHLDDSFSASAALADRELFLRGERFLYCLREK